MSAAGALEDVSLAGPGAEGAVRVPRLWTAFVLGWLLVLATVALLLPGQTPWVDQVLAGWAGLALLGGLYLRVTLRGALAPEDFRPEGPGPALLRRRAGMVAALALVVLGLVALVPEMGMWWLAMHAVVAAGLALPPAGAAAATALLLALALGAAWLVEGRVELLLLVQVAFGAGAVAIRRLTLAVGQLRAAREELARAAVDRERLRFARDLHDLLGHSLSLIALKSELAGRLAGGDPGRAAAEMGDVERAAREALRQVRTAVAGYRRPSLRAELDAARELLAAAGVAAEVRDECGALPPALDGVLAWAVREGVTNVIRHSRARACRVRVRREGGRARVEVADDGPPGEGGTPRGGSGLAGLAERAAPLGGHVEAGPHPGGGFRLALELPLPSPHGGGER